MSWVNYALVYPGTSSDSFFTNGATPPQVQRNYGRQFGGNAASHGGQSDGSVTGGSWLQGFSVDALPSTTIDEWDYFEDFSRCAWVTTGGAAMSGVARSSGLSSGIGGIFAVMNDYSGGNKGWGLYVDAVKGHVNADSTSTIEAEAANLAGPSPRGGATPYNIVRRGQVINLAMGAGSDASIFGRSYAIDAFIEMGDNGAVAHTGINFRNSIMRRGMADDKSAPVATGYARAIAMQYDQGISWYSLSAQVVAATATSSGVYYIIQTVGTTDWTAIGAASNTVGVAFTATGVGTGTGTCSIAGSQAEAVRLYSQVSSNDTRWRMTFNDAAFIIGEGVTPEFNLFKVDYMSAAVNGVSLTPALTGEAVIIAPFGGDTNAGIKITGKGTGKVRIAFPGPYANDAAAAADGVALNEAYRVTGGNVAWRQV